MTTEVRSLREFKMPDVGEGLTEAEILSWYVKPGDTVTDGQVVCEVETAKAAVELPIPFNGVVEQLFFPEGSTVDVGTVIISVAVAGAAGAPAAAAPAAAPVAAAAAPAAEAEPERREVLVGYGPRTGAAQRRARRTAPAAVAAKPAAAPAAPVAPVAPAAPVAPVSAAAPVAELLGGERPLAKPPVRKLAKDLGVDLRAVTPTGPDGVITREDVHAHASAVVAAQAAPAAQPVAAEPVEAAAPAPVLGSTAGDVRVPIKGVRKATAQAMVASAFTAPHVTEFVQVDVTRTMKFVRRLKETGELGRDVRVSPLLLVAKALLVAIKRHPEINAQWDEAAQEIVIRGQVNLGIAAATPRGLIVPNIKDAGAKTLAGLATSLGELIDTARQGKTSPSDMQGGTVTITNVGVFGVDTGTPILNPGEAAILAFGAVRELPWVHKGQVVPRQVTTLALSFDHRLVDGELGSKVLADVAALLEKPKRLITWG
ncbi:dihydrolipoamide acetyltransferase family protein [Kitasatospora sp. NPDC097643]|uniref:dihydrolipoamide acetyltransferase family protein n=1 Tax=Kitasatospora sp. NPDC097643 TaxID=3157230 RepID=UPI0033345312